MIITNPSHYSVALQYERGMPAPVCVAKGTDNIAFKIREIAGHTTFRLSKTCSWRARSMPPSRLTRRSRSSTTMRSRHGAQAQFCWPAVVAPPENCTRERLSGLALGRPIQTLGSEGARFAPVLSRRAASAAMTADAEHDQPREGVSSPEPVRRGGSIVLVLLVAGVLVAVALALMTIGRAQAQPYILGLLAILAMVGLFNLFAFAAGMIRFADRSADNPVTAHIADHAFDGLAVTDARGHVVYFNNAYLALTGMASAQDVRPVERVFIGNPDVSEAVFRLLKAAREGKRQQEEVRIAATDGAHGRWLRMRVRPLGAGKRDGRYAVWSIADITRDRQRQEDVFQQLQHAIEYLDHAPCGFFSVNPSGELVYVNATLANWLD